MRTSLAIVTLYVSACCLQAVASAQATSQMMDQTVVNELQRLELVTQDNGRRISKLEEVKDISARIAVLEDNMFEIKWLSRTVAAALIVQLLVTGSGWMRRRNGHGQAAP